MSVHAIRNHPQHQSTLRADELDTTLRVETYQERLPMRMGDMFANGSDASFKQHEP